MDWSSILENLASEAVTVFIIDRLIQRREERRWKPAKGAMHASIFLALNDLVHTLPDQLIGSEETTYYRFGNSNLMVTGHLQWPLPYKPVEFTSDWAQILGLVDPSGIYRAKERIDEILNLSSLTLEPGLAELLYELDQLITGFKINSTKSPPHSPRERAYSIGLIIYSTGKVIEWLVIHADNQFTAKTLTPDDILPDRPKYSVRRLLNFRSWSLFRDKSKPY